MPINYHEIKKRAWAENIKIINLDEPSIKLKIGNWATLRGIDINDLMLDINNSKYFRLAFIKDPNKQNIYEKAALEFIQGLPLVKDAIKLPTTGEKALFVINGIITPGENTSQTRQSEHKSKSIDFKFTIKRHKQRTADYQKSIE